MSFFLLPSLPLSSSSDSHLLSFFFILDLLYSITLSIRQQLWLSGCGLKSHLLLPLQTLQTSHLSLTHIHTHIHTHTHTHTHKHTHTHTHKHTHTHIYIHARTHTDFFIFSVFSTVLAPGHGYCKMLFEWGTLWTAIVCLGSMMESIFSLSGLLALVTGTVLITYYRWLRLECIHRLNSQDKRE